MESSHIVMAWILDFLHYALTKLVLNDRVVKLELFWILT